MLRTTNKKLSIGSYAVEESFSSWGCRCPGMRKL